MPRDPTEAHAERIEWLREQHMDVVCSVLRRLAVYVPGSLIKQAEAEIRESARNLVLDASRAGEHYEHNRPTAMHTPPDGDRAPVVSVQKTTRRRRG